MKMTTDIPSELLSALLTYDSATRAHLKDCWLGSDDHAALIDARYRVMKEAKHELDRKLSRWTGRHVDEFQAEAKD